MQACLPGQLKNNPDLLVERLAALLEKGHGIKAATATMSRNIIRLPESWTLRKPLSAS